MIPLYRKIRKKMADDNKPMKYMRYALGEIALVVIGILIALQINNWNENRKANLQEAKILKQLKSDLIDNLSEIKEIDFQVSQRHRYSDSISIYFNERRKLDDSLLMYIRGLRNYGIFNSANTAYTYIQSEGMNILSNDSLRAAITIMYERDFRNIDLRSVGEKQMINNVLEPFLRENFKPVEKHVLNSGVHVKALMQPIHIEALYENFEFQNILLEHNSYLEIRKLWLDRTLKILYELIEKTQKEIERIEG